MEAGRIERPASAGVVLKGLLMRYIVALFFFAVLACADPLTVIVVRHAEKAGPTGDVPLSEAGRKRAAALAGALKYVDVAAVYTTDLKRTVQTAQPFADSKGIAITQIRATDLEGLLRAVSAHEGRKVVVVGHSNTVPALISKLGGPPVTLAEEDYDRLFVLTVYAPGKASLVTLRY